MADLPTGWIVACASRSDKGFGVQLIHEDVMTGKMPPIRSIEELIGDRPGWVRGHSTASMDAAFEDAVAKAKAHPPAAPDAEPGSIDGDESELCSDCPPNGYPTDKTRCKSCPRRADPGSALPAGSPIATAIEKEPG